MFARGRARTSIPLTCQPVAGSMPGRRRSSLALGKPRCCRPGTTRVGARNRCPSGSCGCGKASHLKGKKPLNGSGSPSLETTTCEHARPRVDWYRCRWIVEEYHQCLKTGCRIEERHVHTIERLIRLLGLLSPIAVRLLQLRDMARRTPDSAAVESLEPAAVDLIAASLSLPRDASDHCHVLARSRAAGWTSRATARWTARLENPLEGLVASASHAGRGSSGGSPPSVRCG